MHTESSGVGPQTRRDGTQMSLAQSKMMSQLSADNAQWEDRQLLRSGAVRGTELQTEFDNLNCRLNSTMKMRIVSSFLCMVCHAFPPPCSHVDANC